MFRQIVPSSVLSCHYIPQIEGVMEAQECMGDLRVKAHVFSEKMGELLVSAFVEGASE